MTATLALSLVDSDGESLLELTAIAPSAWPLQSLLSRVGDIVGEQLEAREQEAKAAL